MNRKPWAGYGNKNRGGSWKPPPAPIGPPSGMVIKPTSIPNWKAYDKPWLDGNAGGAGGKKKKGGEAGSFLQHCYPNGDGPDTDLITMLEREVVNKNPNVSFDDIAELDDAKKVL
jgi:hypothetical protein